MSLAKTQAVMNGLRSRGITVHEWAGWQTRGNGYTSNYVGGIVHHTGSAYGAAYNALVVGRPDLSGPLCNFAGNEDGSVTVISAGPANHAGASGGYSMGPLPVTQLFNPRVMGLEIVYPGTSPMRPAQYHAATAWARVVADVCAGGNVQSIRAHAETSVTGKWDPGDRDGHTIDMNAFRAASINPVEVPDMTPDEHGALDKLYKGFVEDGSLVTKVADKVLDTVVSRAGSYGQTAGGGQMTLRGVVQYWANNTDDMPARVADKVNTSGIDYDLLADEVSQRITATLATAVAKAVNDELARRLES